MILFVDESENSDLFLVCGIAVESREVATNAYKKFKRAVQNYPISPNERAKVFTEFKSVLLDKKYQRIKLRMIEEISKLDCKIIYACFPKGGVAFTQDLKEKTYINLLTRITKAISEDVSIVFDTFNKPVFQETIINTLSKHEKVQAIMPRDSQLEEGLQFADNLCSILRQYKTTGQVSTYYQLLNKRIIEV